VCCKNECRTVHGVGCGRAEGVVGWFVIGQYWWVHPVVPFVVLAITNAWGSFLAVMVGSWFENVSM